MRLPFHTASTPLKGNEARRVTRAVDAGRAVSNARARAFAAECVSQWKAELHQAELRAGWDTLRMGRVPAKIEPLE